MQPFDVMWDAKDEEERVFRNMFIECIIIDVPFAE